MNYISKCQQFKLKAEGMRSWQQECLKNFDAYYDERTDESPAFLFEACPGAGKTRMMFHLMSDLVERHMRTVDHRVLVVVPSDHLRNQMIHDAAQHGIQLTRDIMAVSTSDAYYGLVTTYHFLAKNPGLLEAWVRKNTNHVVAFMDEFHHMGDEKPWGSAARQVLDGCVLRVMCSGTPFRTDGARMPYVPVVEVGDEWQTAPHSVYDYADAVADGVVRPVLFEEQNSDNEWSSALDGQIYNADFNVDLDGRLETERLATTLDPQMDYFQKVYSRALDRIESLRSTSDPDAAILVVCRDTKHADDVAGAIQGISGEYPVVVHSNEDNASQKIQRFRRSRTKTLVSVKMVSEGVDIPRLRALIYMTNVKTELNWMQTLGRVFRYEFNDEGERKHLDPGEKEVQSAFAYIYADPVLMRWAKSLMDRIMPWIRQNQVTLPPVVTQGRGPGSPQGGIFTPIASDATGLTMTIGRHRITSEEYDWVETHARSLGLYNASVAEIAVFMKHLKQVNPDLRLPAAPINASQQSRDEICQELCGRIHKTSKQLAHLAAEVGLVANGDDKYRYVNLLSAIKWGAQDSIRFEEERLSIKFKGLLQWQHLAATDPDALEKEWKEVQS
jgi:superfamily II DNA or RNA helicase